MTARIRAAFVVLAASLVAARPAVSQSDQSVAAAIARAAQRAASGDSTAARAILDSLQSSNPDNTAESEIAYWRSRFAASPGERERRLTVFVVDFPFSGRVGPALFELGSLELAHSDRDRAATHFARFLTTTPVDSNRTAASLALGRILLDRGEGPRACAVLLAGRAEIPPTSIEIRNQFEFSVGTCRGVDTSVTAPPMDTSKTRSVIGEYTVQVAAFDLRDQADRLATKLRGQGLEARVIGIKKPFRVRVGHFVTRGEADAEARRIGIITNSKPFVVIVGTEEM